MGMDRVGGLGDSALAIQISLAGWKDVIHRLSTAIYNMAGHWSAGWWSWGVRTQAEDCCDSHGRVLPVLH